MVVVLVCVRGEVGWVMSAPRGDGGGGATWAVFRSVGHFPPEWVPMDAG